MDLTAELTALNLDCAQQKGVVAAVLPLQQKAAETDKLRAQAKFDALKIQALTLELAHLKRIRFGVKNEALSPEQRDLFRETLEVDSAAIAAETEQQVPACASHASAPGGNRYPSSCRASSTVTSLLAAPAASAAARWSRSAKTSASSWMSPRQRFLCIGTSVRNTLRQLLLRCPTSCIHVVVPPV